MKPPVRVRFAPSPTGPLHIGGLRTALFNYLFAKKHNGVFILRIEDTDQKRYVEKSEEHIYESLNWAGLTIDEGPVVGKTGYKQSERGELYKEKISYLINKKFAYYAFDTQNELSLLREECEKNGDKFIYGPKNREKLRNSISFGTDKTNELLSKGCEYVVRFKIPESTEIECIDFLKGKIRVQSNSLDDKVLYKSDGTPTYHFANVVDDLDMKISHVIRGEEWLPSLPLHSLIYSAFEKKEPVFVHLPLILKPVGKGKLSKRDGDKFGFPVFPISWNNGSQEIKGFREEGFLPGAVLNFLALLGWNPGNEKEFFLLSDLIKSFSIDALNKSSARFDPKKNLWFNQKHIQSLKNSQLEDLLFDELKRKKVDFDKNKITQIVPLIKDRLTLTTNILETSNYFFSDPKEFDLKFLKKFKDGVAKKLLSLCVEVLSDLDFSKTSIIKKTLEDFASKKEIGFGKLLGLLRISLVGKLTGADLFETMKLLGKKTVLKRLLFLSNYIG